MSRIFQYLTLRSWLALLLAVLLVSASALAQSGAPSASVAPAPSGSAAAAPSSEVPPAAPKLPDDVAALVLKAARVRALTAGQLDIAVAPATLFEVDLSDERAVLVELKRLQRVLRAPPPDAGADADAAASVSTQKRTKPTKKPAKPEHEVSRADAGVDAAAAAVPSPPDAQLLEARLDLDSARLEFLELPQERRDALLQDHQKRVEEGASKANETAAKISQTEETRATAEAEQLKALEQAKLAKTEILRLLNQERARLLGVRVKQADYEKRLLETERKLDEFGETKLEWQRKTDEHVKQRTALKATAADTDQLYFELRAALRQARHELRESLDALSNDADDVPSAGPDKVDSTGLDLNRTEYDELRSEVLKHADELRLKARSLTWKRATALLDVVESLNRDRLEFYVLMSPAQRRQLTSFGSVGVDQAQAELSQLTLVIRYHIRAAVTWIKDPSAGGAKSIFASIVLVKLLLLIGVMSWWRRRADDLLGSLAAQAEEQQQRVDPTLFGRWGPSAIAIMRRVRAPLETLFAVWLGLSFFGPDVTDLLEVQLFWIITSWVLGGSVIVLFLDAIAARSANAYASKTDVPALRLRTLRVLGHVVVFFGLVLALSSEMVGKGTLYDWVLSTGWLIAIPLLLMFVGWWREVIFERLVPREKRSALAGWVVRNQEGYRSFFAAALGGGYLLGLGVIRLGRDYLITMTLVRKLLAYLFRRELSKKADKRPKLSRIPAEQYEALAPEQEAKTSVPTAADEELTEISDRIAQVGGGVFAIVGERGSGKTTLLKRVVLEHPHSIYVKCPTGGAAPLLTQLRQVLKLTADAPTSAIIAALDAIEDDNALLLDCAHRLVKPTIGGLKELDQILALARDSSGMCTWVFAFDSTMFELVERARGTRPIFDDVVVMQPWREEAIAELLETRTEACGLTPSFEGLFEAGVEGDEIERAEQLASTKRGYYRLLWDYSAGNPAVALHFWRKSLGVDDTGLLQVGLFSAPSTTDLEQLPDAASFVLRAIVRLDPATIDGIAETTRLPLHQVLDAVRYADFRGYLSRDDAGRLRITWTWFRAVTRVLARRHLLNVSL